MTLFRSRPGVTLVELMLFMTLIAIAAGAMFSFFILTTDARVRQRAHADIEQVGVQLTQQLIYEVRTAERVLLPAKGMTGSVLVLQTESSDGSPLIFAAESGVLLLVRGTNTHLLSSQGFLITDFEVANTSTNDASPSVAIALTIVRTLPLPQPELLRVPLELGITLSPVDIPLGNTCGCAAPVCTDGVLSWGACLGESCNLMESSEIHCS